jgi:hypothetical protein
MDDQARELAETNDRRVAVLRGAADYIESLPEPDRSVAQRAAEGAPAWAIANETELSEAAVHRILDSVVAALTGREIEPVETGGLGSDTDPGVTGGYGDTGFGALDTEPLPDNTEPDTER